MRATLTTARSQVIATADAKLFLRVDHGDEDTLIDSMVQAATDIVAKHLRMNLGAETWTIELPAFRDVVRVPVWPLNGVTSIAYVDGDGLPQTLPATSVFILREVSGDSIVRKPDTTWPATQTENPGAVTFTVTTGDASLPDAVLGAIRLLTGTMYDQRNEVVTGQTAVGLPFGVRQILAGYRRFT